MGSFLKPRTRLARALSANQPGSSTPHTVVVLPSYSVGESMLAHYGHRIPALEHRQLLSVLMLPHVERAQILFVTSQRPERKVLDYYLSLVPVEHRRAMRARIRIIEVADPTPRSVTDKLLDRPDLVARLRRMARGGLAYIEPWNVTPNEMELARRLGMPLNGTAADLWPLGFKSNGRRVMRSAGVPLPLGHEDVRSVGGVVAAADGIRQQHPDAAGVIVKTDNASTGDGNRILRFSASTTVTELRNAVESLDPMFLADVRRGAVVEELVVGAGFACPSVQLDIKPGGHVEVLSTHEQLMGGPDGQEYLGCQFPANPSYRDVLPSYGVAVGRALATQGALGRVGVDFAAVQSAAGSWDIYGLEINLRKCGTNHPQFTLRNLVPGRYDDATGRWITEDGSERCYLATDNLVDPSWVGRPMDDVVRAIRSAGLEFDRHTRTGLVLHMFSGLDIDGRIGLTAIGVSPAHAEELYGAGVMALSLRSARAQLPLPV